MAKIEFTISAENAQAIKALQQVAGAAEQVRRSLKDIGTGVDNELAGMTNSAGAFLGALSKVRIAGTGIIGIFHEMKNVADKVFGTGINYNKQMEIANLHIAGILMNMTKLNDEQLNLNQTMQISSQVIEQIQEKAVGIGLNFEELSNAFQSIIDPGLQVKTTLEEIVQLTTIGTKSVQNLLGSMSNDAQITQELQSLVSGSINQDSQVSKLLGLTDGDVAKTKESAGGLFSYLLEKVSGFKEIETVLPDTLVAEMERFDAMFTQASGNAFEAVFGSLSNKISEITDALFKVDEQTKEVSFNPELLSYANSLVNYTILLEEKIENAGKAILPYLIGPLNSVVEVLGVIVNNIYGITAAIATWLGIQKVISLIELLNNAIDEQQQAMAAAKMTNISTMAATSAGANTAAVAVSRIEAAAVLAKNAIRTLGMATLWGAIAAMAGWAVEKIMEQFDKVGQHKSETQSPDATDPTILGSLSSKYESNGEAGKIGNTKGDPGGKSYGAWQLSINSGSLKNFIDWLNANNWEAGPFLSRHADYENGLIVDHDVIPGSKEFDGLWQKAVEKFGDSFLDAQRQFVKQSYYDVTASGLSNTGLDVSKRSNALKQVVWSTSVQHGPKTATNIIQQAAELLGYPNGSYATDEQLIKAIYQVRGQRIKQDPYLSEDVRDSVLNRYFGSDGELNAALTLNHTTNPINADLDLKGDAGELARASSALKEVIANNRLQEYIKELQDQEQQLEARYTKTNAGLASGTEKISTQDYTKQKINIATIRTDAEIAYDQQQIDEKNGLLSNKSEKEKLEIQAEIEKLKSNIKQKKQDLKMTIDGLNSAKDTAMQALQDDATDVIASNKENKGDLIGAEVLRLGKRNRSSVSKFSANNMTEAQTALEENAAYDLRKTRYSQAQKELEIANGQLVEAQQSFMNDLVTGVKSSEQVSNEYAEMYKEKTDPILSELQQIIDSAKGDPAIINAVNGLKRQIIDGKGKMSDVIIQRADTNLQNEVSMINADRSLTTRQRKDLVDEATRKTYAAKAAEYTQRANDLKKDNNHDNAATIIDLETLAELNRKLSETPTLLEQIQEVSKQTFEDGLLDFLERGVFECKNLADAFLNLASSVLQSIQKVYAEALTKNIMSLLGLGATEQKKSVLGTTDSTGFYYEPNFGVKPLFSFAEGGSMDSGKVTGPGTETSDSILAWAGNIKKFIRIANGEFVLRGAAVKKYGTAFLERLNSGIIPSGMLQRYAIGGSLTDRIPSGSVIGPQEMTANLSNNTTIPLNIMNVVDQGMMGKFLQTREGKKALLNYIKDDAGTIRRVLNIPG